jgi:hypothetical protein
MQVTTSAPEAACSLLEVCRDVAYLPAGMARRKTILCSICLNSDCEMAEVLQQENILRFCHSRQGYQEEGEVAIC